MKKRVESQKHLRNAMLRKFVQFLFFKITLGIYDDIKMTTKKIIVIFFKGEFNITLWLGFFFPWRSS
jgi:hypothetical protein